MSRSLPHLIEIPGKVTIVNVKVLEKGLKEVCRIHSG